MRRVADAVGGGTPIAAPRFNGTRGHPVGFSRRFASELAALRGDSGARDVLERHRSEIVLIDCDDPGVLLDIDARADLDQEDPALIAEEWLIANGFIEG